MAGTVTVVVNQEADEEVVKCAAAILRSNNAFASQLREFVADVKDQHPPNGIAFQPSPGQILACHFGLGFRVPEMTKTRPVLVISPHQRVWTRLCVVVPISSKEPETIEPYHLKLPAGLVPGEKYHQAWIKGDSVMAVADHRLDRLKVGFRQYVAPIVPAQILKEIRRCILHATGMHALTTHW
jgi:uncharacterized protein YifN (PemK superfamily)